MNTLEKTKKNVEELSSLLINDEWESLEEEDSFVNDYIKKYEEYVNTELNWYYKLL